MKKRILALSCLMAMIALPAMANTGDFNITNNSDTYGTIQIGYFPCSSWAGEEGIMKPHALHVFTHTLISTICGKSCSADFYPSNNCSGKIIGTAKIDEDLGVISYTNNDEAHYSITGAGFDFTINQISA